MARKVTTDDIKQFNELYYKHKSYAEVARITGWSSSTVSKYIDKNYQPVASADIKRFNVNTDLPEFNSEIFVVENLGDLFVLSEDELVEMIDFHKELAI
jgi:hypothetical protein